uniref:Phytanoyl-CoA dioxygenase n=1 Tax=viral metagenome TaxID=1070528 RepID=A0A6C0AQH5_9ZZZZ
MSNIHIYYPELIESSFWGEDTVMLKEDINLLEKTPFHSKGYGILPIQNNTEFLRQFIQKNISEIIGSNIDIEKYHSYVNEEQHKQVLNSMPYKKKDTVELQKFCEYMEAYISAILQEKVKMFNDDIWVRICRPNRVSKEDFNPCHRDVYLDFYRNTVNIYMPIIGSDEKSSLLVQEGSHLWNENTTAVTRGGAHFKHKNKKYSVDAIVQSKIDLMMIRPNPAINEMLVFSPYLIHGCSDNNNDDTTRMSLEIRFIRDDEKGIQQENDINEFIKSRVWR